MNKNKKCKRTRIPIFKRNVLFTAVYLLHDILCVPIHFILDVACLSQWHFTRTTKLVWVSMSCGGPRN